LAAFFLFRCSKFAIKVAKIAKRSNYAGNEPPQTRRAQAVSRVKSALYVHAVLRPSKPEY
jgi:hypothetical protein